MHNYPFDSLIFDFWVKRAPWPKALGHVFLGDAVLRFGRCVFGAEWRDFYPVVEQKPWQITGDDVRARLRARFRESELREMIGAAEAAASLSMTGRQAAHARFVTAQNKIAELATSGVLKTAVRPVNGGTVVELPWHFWQTEILEPRFALCQIDPREPFSHKLNGPTHCYIFITEDSLSQALSETSSADPRHSGSGTIRAETQCQEWLESEMRKSLQKRPRPRDAFQREALDKFEGLSQRGFERAWRAAIVTSGAVVWQLAGRPGKGDENHRDENPSTK